MAMRTMMEMKMKMNANVSALRTIALARARASRCCGLRLAVRPPRTRFATVAAYSLFRSSTEEASKPNRDKPLAPLAKQKEVG